MQKIVPNLWFNHNAKEAVDFYTSVFEDSRINEQSYYPKSEEEGLADFQKDLAGKVLTIDFEISGYRFTAINADTTFKPNPSISFFYTCDTKEETDELWEKLADGGKVLMELGEYPFSKYYGWVQDKFGYSWQLILNNPKGDKRPKIVPSLMFTQTRDGHAEDAMKFYTSIFKESEISKNLNHYPSDMPDKTGKISYADFKLFDQWFAVMDGGNNHDFSFNPAISLMVKCKDQEEIDYYWEKLSANPNFEQCGWLEDKYGVSWQITPVNIEELLKTPGGFKRMMNMKKLDIAELQDTKNPEK
ncbi:MAG TPA: VOC family protein [Candidatus Saccharimonadales bacterium]|nr:VOC family protein [Candidatus Saccharimonadales bacterium]